MTQDNLSNARRMIADAKLTVGWSQVKVRMNCCAELQQVFTYKRSALTASQSGYLVVGCTELVAKTDTFALFDAYETYRIWKLSSEMIEFMRRLSLKPVLLSDQNVKEFEYILELIFGTKFLRLLQHFGSCSRRCGWFNVLAQKVGGG